MSLTTHKLTTHDLTVELKTNFATRKPLRTGSLIVTVFGDSVAAHGGMVWIGSLIQALAPLGISERLVRTAVFRLVQDGILSSEQDGRRSFYALTKSGRAQFDDATVRIYSQPDTPWDGNWSVVLLSGVPAKQRAAIRQSLSWHGFGQLGIDTLAHPWPDKARTEEHLQRLGVRETAVLLDAAISRQENNPGLQLLVAQAWNLASLETAYSEYMDRFIPVLEALQRNPDIQEADAFYIRTFMIHEYRKTVLRDPALPVELLPQGWKGHAAYDLSRDLYRHIAAPSERHIQKSFENQQGALPASSASFASRFGGLTD